MYPVLFSVGGFEVTSFGVLVAIAALVGVTMFRRELARSGLSENAVDGAIIGVLAGLAGAKLLWVFEHLGEETFTGLLFSRGGLSWFGGLVGGVGAALIYFVVKGYPLVRTIAAATPALAAGHAIGRIGCFLVGDDYGRPTDLPWGVAFPRGLPPTTDRVHPTQLYEAAFLAVLTVLLIRWRRHGVRDQIVLGRYLALAGAARFLIEFIRVNVRVLDGLTVAHLAALLLMLAGVLMIATAPRRSVSTTAPRRTMMKS
jgi:phosphatidylglycerol:prolipoprotein diacylglycerol transferase